MASAMKKFLTLLDNYFFSMSSFNTLGLLRIALCYWVVKPYFYFPLLKYPQETNLYEGAYQASAWIRFFSLPFPVSGEQLNWLHFALFIV
jgi:hypothetical protein